MRFTYDDLSLVIFEQPTELPPKFLKLRSCLEQISKHFGLQLILGSHNWTDNLLRCPELDPVWILLFLSVLLNCLKPPGKIITSVLETQSSTCHELWFDYMCTIETVELSVTFSSILLNWLQKQGHTLCMWENTTLIDMVVARWLSASLNEVETRLSIAMETRLLIVVETRLSIVVETRLSITFETRLSKCEDRVRYFQMRMQAPRWMRVSLELSLRYAPRISATERPIKDLGLSTVNSLWLFIIFDRTRV